MLEKMHLLGHLEISETLFIFSLFLHTVLPSASTYGAGRFRRDVAYEENHLHGWGYDIDNGPETWCKETPSCCGLLQSPINIIGDESTHVDYPRLILSHYNVPRTVFLSNNGHTVVITPRKNVQSPTVTGGGFRDTYVLDSIHFHWGPNSRSGSEHTRNGLAYPLEAHFVHHNTKYSTLAEAQLHSDGLAVLGVFYNVSTRDNHDLSPVIDDFVRVQYADDSVEVKKPVILRNLLPRILQFFYRYKGSLTTPPCSEVVTWTLFDDALGISERQLQQFRQDVHYNKAATLGVLQGYGHGDTRLTSNHRSVQQGHDRVVQHNVPRLKFLKRIVNGVAKPLSMVLKPINRILKPMGKALQPLNQIFNPLKNIFTKN